MNKIDIYTAQYCHQRECIHVFSFHSTEVSMSPREPPPCYSTLFRCVIVSPTSALALSMRMHACKSQEAALTSFLRYPISCFFFLLITGLMLKQSRLAGQQVPGMFLPLPPKLSDYKSVTTA